MPGVHLRALEDGDDEVLRAAENNPALAGEHSWHGFREARGGAEGRYLTGDQGTLVVSSGDDLIGTVGWYPVHHGPGDVSRSFNVGIWLLPEARGHGHGATALRALADYLFTHTRVERVEASTDVENLAAQRALESAGFEREGVLRSAQFRAGRWHDMVGYSVIRSEWKGPA